MALPHADSTIDEPIAQPGNEPLSRLADKLTGDVLKKFRELRQDAPESPEQIGHTTPVLVQPAHTTTVPASAQTNGTPQPVAQPAAAQTAPQAQPTVEPDPSADPAIPAHERPPAGAAKATKEDWMRFRALMHGKIEAKEKEREALAKEVETLRKSAKGVPTEEFEALKQAHTRAEAELERVALARSERFRNHYDGGIARSIKLAKSAAGKHGLEVEGLLQNLTPDAEKRLGEIREELGIRGNILDTAIANIMSLQIEREEQLNNHAENIKVLRMRESTEAAESLQKTTARRTALANALVARAQALPEFKADPADAQHTSFSGGAIDFIRNAALGNLSEEDSALLPVAAMKAQFYEGIEKPKLMAELTALRERIAQLTSATPRVEGQQRGVQGQAGGATPRTALNAQNYDPQKATAEIVKKFNDLRGQVV